MRDEIGSHIRRVTEGAFLVVLALCSYLLLTRYSVTDATGRAVGCDAALTEAGRSRAPISDPTFACYDGAVHRLQLAVAYLASGLGVGIVLSFVARRARRRPEGSRPSWPSTPGEVYALGGLVFVVLIGIARGTP
jgi:hypothetical protein